MGYNSVSKINLKKINAFIGTLNKIFHCCHLGVYLGESWSLLRDFWEQAKFFLDLLSIPRPEQPNNNIEIFQNIPILKTANFLIIFPFIKRRI